MSRFFQSKVSGIIIDDSNYGLTHAWSPNRIVKEITDKLTDSIGKIDMSLISLKDVNIKTPANGQVLQYNSTTAKWENKAITIKTRLSELTDVNLSNLANKYVLQYNSGTGKFDSAPISLRMQDLTNFDTSTLGNNYIVKYDSSTGKFKTSPYPNLKELPDVNTNGLEDKSVLQYSQVEGKFKTLPMFRLEDLRNVDGTNVMDGNALFFSKSKGKFVFAPIDAKTKFADLLDVDVTNLRDGNVVAYSEDLRKYVTKPLSLTDLIDVDATDLQNNFVLKYDAEKQKFVFVKASFGGGEGGIEQNYYNNNYNSTSQVSRLGVIATPEIPKSIDIPIPFIEDFNLGKLDVLKYEAGQIITNNIVHFDRTDGSGFNYNEKMVAFDGTMHLNTEITVTQNEYETVEGGKIFTIPVNYDDWENVSNIEVL